MFETAQCWDSIYELVFPTQPKWTSLTFDYKAWLKMQCYINLVGDYEITGFGRVVDDRVVDVKILKQEVKSATVDCDVDSMLEFMRSIPKDQIGQWILDWHSHVKMSVFASGTDTDNYKAQFEARCSSQFPLMIINQMGEVYSKVYISPSKQTPLTIKVEKSPITREELLALYESCKKDVEELCSKKTYTYTKADYYSDYDWGKYYGYNATKVESGKLPTTSHGQCGCKKKDQNSDDIIDTVDNDSINSSIIKKIDTDDYCISCQTYLIDNDEYDRGLCNDCWEKMTYQEKYQYLSSTGKSYLQM